MKFKKCTHDDEKCNLQRTINTEIICAQVITNTKKELCRLELKQEINDKETQLSEKKHKLQQIPHICDQSRWYEKKELEESIINLEYEINELQSNLQRVNK